MNEKATPDISPDAERGSEEYAKLTRDELEQMLQAGEAGAPGVTAPQGGQGGKASL
jgi:hypothetical protein